MKIMKFYIVFALLMPSIVSAQSTSMTTAYELFSTGELEKALVQYNQLEAANTNNAEFFFLRGSCLSELGDDANAVKDLDVAISLDANNANAFYQRGFSYFSLGNSKMALADFNSTIVLDASYGEAYLNRGTIKYDLGKKDEACADWKKSLEMGLNLAESLIAQLCE